MLRSTIVNRCSSFLGEGAGIDVKNNDGFAPMAYGIRERLARIRMGMQFWERSSDERELLFAIGKIDALIDEVSPEEKDELREKKARLQKILTDLNYN